MNARVVIAIKTEEQQSMSILVLQLTGEVSLHAN